MGGALNNVVEQKGSGYFQSSGDFPERAESHVGCAALDLNEMRAMQAASLGKGRLRRPVFSLAKVADSGPQRLLHPLLLSFFLVHSSV